MSTDDRMTKSEALRDLQGLLEKAKSMQASHKSIRADDDQYEDPEEWWLNPLVAGLEKTIRAVENS